MRIKNSGAMVIVSKTPKRGRTGRSLEKDNLTQALSRSTISPVKRKR